METIEDFKKQCEQLTIQYLENYKKNPSRVSVKGIVAIVDQFTINRHVGSRVDRVDDEDEEVRVELAWNTPEAKLTNLAFAHMQEDQRLEFLKHLLAMWADVPMDEALKKDKNPSSNLAQLHTIFGIGYHEPFIGEPTFYTLTEDRKEFRCWYYRPHAIRRTHVSSSGAGLVWGVYGPPRKVSSFVEQLIPEWIQSPICVQNGVKIYGIFWA